MKKVTSVVVLLVLISTSVFAAPVTAMVENKQKETVSEFDLFDTVQATELTGQEMKAVEGEGLFMAIVGAVTGSITCGFACAQTGNTVLTVLGAIGGGIYGAYVGYVYDTATLSYTNKY